MLKVDQGSSEDKHVPVPARHTWMAGQVNPACPGAWIEVNNIRAVLPFLLMADVPNITTEILVQIRDEMRGMRADLGERIDGLGERIDSLRNELGERIDGLRSELKVEMQELRTIIVRHGRVVDGTLEASLQDSGRLDVLEGRVGVLEAEVRELRSR